MPSPGATMAYEELEDFFAGTAEEDSERLAELNRKIREETAHEKRKRLYTKYYCNLAVRGILDKVDLHGVARRFDMFFMQSSCENPTEDIENAFSDARILTWASFYPSIAHQGFGIDPTVANVWVLSRMSELLSTESRPQA